MDHGIVLLGPIMLRCYFMLSVTSSLPGRLFRGKRRGTVRVLSRSGGPRGGGGGGACRLWNPIACLLTFSSSVIRPPVLFVACAEDGNLVLREGKPGDSIAVSPLWESGRPFAKKVCTAFGCTDTYRIALPRPQMNAYSAIWYMRRRRFYSGRGVCRRVLWRWWWFSLQ